jgi:hypothetical protein
MTVMTSAEQKADSKPVNLGTSAAKSVSHGSRSIGDRQSVSSLLLHVPFTIGVLYRYLPKMCSLSSTVLVSSIHIKIKHHFLQLGGQQYLFYYEHTEARCVEETCGSFVLIVLG